MKTNEKEIRPELEHEFEVENDGGVTTALDARIVIIDILVDKKVAHSTDFQALKQKVAEAIKPVLLEKKEENWGVNVNITAVVSDRVFEEHKRDVIIKVITGVRDIRFGIWSVLSDALKEMNDLQVLMYGWTAIEPGTYYVPFNQYYIVH